MASDYGLNFGFRRSDETMAIREGRQKVPAAGEFRQGMGVCFDDANPGFVKLMEPGDPAVTGWSGLLVQEDAHLGSVYGSDVLGGESFALNVVKNNRLCTIWSGNGTKVWFKNTAEQTRADGRVIPAADLVDFDAGGGVAIGAYLGVTAPGVWGVVGAAGSSAPDEAQMVVTLTNGTDYLEAVLIK